MPVKFPGPLADDGTPTEVTYWNVSECSERLHVTRQTVRDMCKKLQWPHLRVNGRFYMSDAQLARAVEIMTTDVDEIPEWSPTLGTVTEPWDETEGVQ